MHLKIGSFESKFKFFSFYVILFKNVIQLKNKWENEVNRIEQRKKSYRNLNMNEWKTVTFGFYSSKAAKRLEFQIKYTNKMRMKHL